MASTDTFVPGFSLHDELALLVRAGLTEMAALQSATRQPARYLGLSDTSDAAELDRMRASTEERIAEHERRSE